MGIQTFYCYDDLERCYRRYGCLLDANAPMKLIATIAVFMASIPLVTIVVFGFGLWNRARFIERMREVMEHRCSHQMTEASISGQGVEFKIVDRATLGYLLNRIENASPGSLGGTNSYLLRMDWDDGVSVDARWSPYPNGWQVQFSAATEFGNLDYQNFEIELTNEMPEELRNIVASQLAIP